MAVLGDREQRAFDGVAAGELHRDFAFKLDEAFEYAGLLAEFAERSARFLVRVDPRLALAGVAEAGDFEDRGRTGVGQAGVEGALVVYQCERRGGEAVLGEPGFLVAAILGNGDGCGAGRYPAEIGEFDQARGGDVLEFGGDGSAGSAELLTRTMVGVVGLQVDVRHLPGRAGEIGVEHHDLVAHGARGDGEHAAELAAAQNTEGGAGQDGQRLTRHRAGPSPSRSRIVLCGNRAAVAPGRCRSERAARQRTALRWPRPLRQWRKWQLEYPWASARWTAANPYL